MIRYADIERHGEALEAAAEVPFRSATATTKFANHFTSTRWRRRWTSSTDVNTTCSARTISSRYRPSYDPSCKHRVRCSSCWSLTLIKTAVPCCFSTWCLLNATTQIESHMYSRHLFMMDPCVAHQMRDSTVYKQSTILIKGHLKVQEDEISLAFQFLEQCMRLQTA